MDEQQYIYAFARNIELGILKIKEIEQMLPPEILEKKEAITTAYFSIPYVIYIHCKEELTKEGIDTLKEIINPGY